MELKQPVMRVDLFPTMETRGGYWAMREYVEDQMLAAIADGSFWLSEMMNQRDPARGMVGDIILGHAIDDGSHGRKKETHFVDPTMVNPIIAAHQVRIESLWRGCKDHAAKSEPTCERCARDRYLQIKPGKPTIRYTDGMAMVKTQPGGGRHPKRQPQMTERIITLDVTEADLDLRRAFLVLREWGAWVRFAEHEDDREFYWLFREVSPAELAQRMAGDDRSKKAKQHQPQVAA